MEPIEKPTHWFLHVDLDAFFASVEQLDHPEYRGKPVIVGGLPEDRRSVVSTASYEARKYGVHSAMPTFQAYKLCPNGIFVHGRMHRYAELSYQIMNIFRDFSPDVDQMSIDEAFIDLTGTEKLFGPPAETAALIKKRVKQETGLTVSMGLATTKYLAKIASGLFKPDGFCHIKSGDEENFMLNLPLNKVWGLGPKSLDLIRSKGFKTTRDLYERDFDTLNFLFGKNMASFLYNVVRGIEKESFSRESKSHSISAETTFPYDLTDIYMIETELLELAHGVFFRLLKEEGYSRTAFVKIRYDDFSTSTVQETVDRNIITLDSFYEIIKRLFEKRYENGRGIRLLGVGFENIVKEERPYQQDLFDNNDEKKQAVEKAILNLSKKHPEIKVQKARTLKAIIAAVLILCGGEKINAQSTLFDYKLDDRNHVDFSVSGRWVTDFESGLDITFGNGTTPAASPQFPIFKQEVELQTLLTLNKKWYFQADFADEFTTNTFAFGYKSDDLIRHFRLANRGITMPSGYSSEYFGYGLQGGNNQAPGLSLLLKPQNEKWQADFLVRYDMTEVKSSTYYGMNKATDIVLSPADFLYGREFRFPEGTEAELAQIDAVFVESAGGKWRDSRGKTYRKLTKDEFAAVIGSKRLFISKDAGSGKNARGEVPAVVVSFGSEGCVDAVIAAAGRYDTPNTFLGQIQNELFPDKKYQLSEYTGELKTTIEGMSALIIQGNDSFSPFLCPALYDTGKYETDVFIQAGKSGNSISKYKTVSSQDFYTSLYVDFFNDKQSFTKILNSENENSVYPFSQDCPEIYLGLNTKSSLEIYSRSYTPIKEIIIPKTAASGTIQVYKNGILVPGISFNENTGVIDLNTSVSPADKIVVTWQEETSDFSSGALALGAGYKLNILPGWDADISLTARQSINQKEEYSYQENQKNSFAALSAGTIFEKNGFKFSEKTNISYLDENTSKGLLLYSWDETMENYEQELKEALYPEKVEKEKPEKTAKVSFSPSDFRSYTKINIELESGENTTTLSSPLLLIFDEDTGTDESVNKALYLKINDSSLFTAQNKKHTINLNLENKTVSVNDIPLSPADYELKINNSIIPSRLFIEPSADDIFITKLSYEKAKPYGTFKNYLSAEYKKNDFYLSTESTQGTGSFSSPDFFINTKSQANFTLLQINFSGDISSENKDITQAGHSIKTSNNLFGMLYAEDTYRKDFSTNELRKQNSFSLNFNPIKIPLKADLKTTSSSFLNNSKQNAELSLDFEKPIFSTQFSIGTKITAAQKIYDSTQSTDTSYIADWQNILNLSFSTGKDNADSRSNQYITYLSAISPLKQSNYTLKPKFTYELSDEYNTGSPDTLFTDKETLKLNIPVTGNKKSFSFEIARTGGGTQNTTQKGTYISDSQKLFELQNKRTWFYTQIPFYELFNNQIHSELPQNTKYGTSYEANFRRSLFNSIKDLYIPSAITLSINREITTIHPESDIYQIKAIITNNSINNFGSTSVKKTFLWFKQEELTTSLTTLVKIPSDDPENFKLRIQAFSQLLLYISEKSNLTEIFDFSIENTADWNLRNIVTYTRPSKTSLITDLIQYLVPEARTNLPNQNYSVSRKDSFTFEIGDLETNLHQKYEYNHTVSVDFMEYYNIYAGINCSLFLNQEKANKINLSVNLGAKAEF